MNNVSNMTYRNEIQNQILYNLIYFQVLQKYC